MGYDRVQLKQAAKHAMKLQHPHPMLITLLFSIIAGIGSQIVSSVLGAASGLNGLTTTYFQAFLQYEDPAYAIQYALLSFGLQRLALALFMGSFVAGIITSLWSGLMRTGYSNFCLGMVRGQQPQTGALFSAFPQFGGVLLTQFLALLFRFLWALLFGAAAIFLIVVLALLFHDLPGLLAILLLVVYTAAIVGIVWVTLRYAMVDFLLADQNLTGMDAIRESKRLMRGNTGRLFTLELSFIGWYLLEIGIILVFAMIGATAFGAGLSAGGLDDPMLLMAGTSLGIFGLVSIASIAVFIFNLWLTPYIIGSEALFYDWTRGVDSVHPTGGFGGGQGGWDQPYPPQQHYNYTWKPNPTSGTGIGSGSQDGGNPPQPPKPPKSPKDDPWD